MAGVYYQLGFDEQALSLCDEIIKTCEKPTILLGAKLIYANNYLRRCNLKAAKEAYDKCLSEVERKIGYAKIELAKYNFEGALEILNSIDTKDENALYNMHTSYAQIMFRFNKYDEFMEYYNKIMGSKQIDKHLDSLVDIKRMRLLLEVKNNLPLKEKNMKYADKQIVNYNTTRAINHIIDRHIDQEYSENFSRSSNIGKLYYHIIENLDKFSNQKFCDTLYDKYIVNLQEIGYEEENVRFVTVVCIADTYNIITMYPSNRYTGVFGEEEPKEKIKQKRLTAKEKFEMKYGSGF